MKIVSRLAVAAALALAVVAPTVANAYPKNTGNMTFHACKSKTQPNHKGFPYGRHSAAKCKTVVLHGGYPYRSRVAPRHVAKKAGLMAGAASETAIQFGWRLATNYCLRYTGCTNLQYDFGGPAYVGSGIYDISYKFHTTYYGWKYYSVCVDGSGHQYC